MLLIANAIASETNNIQSGASLASFIPLIIVFVIFYFLLIRPQQKKFKQHDEMVRGLKKGDKIHTAGGIIGIIKTIDDKHSLLNVEIAEGVVVEVVKDTVSALVEDKKKSDSSKSKDSKKKHQKSIKR